MLSEALAQQTAAAAQLRAEAAKTREAYAAIRAGPDAPPRVLPGRSKAEAVERAIEDNVPAEFQRHAHHWLILHGRYVCVARKPKCEICKISDLCPSRELFLGA